MVAQFIKLKYPFSILFVGLLSLGSLLPLAKANASSVVENDSASLPQPIQPQVSPMALFPYQQMTLRLQVSPDGNEYVSQLQTIEEGAQVAIRLELENLLDEPLDDLEVGVMWQFQNKQHGHYVENSASSAFSIYSPEETLSDQEVQLRWDIDRFPANRKEELTFLFEASEQIEDFGPFDVTLQAAVNAQSWEQQLLSRTAVLSFGFPPPISYPDPSDELHQKVTLSPVQIPSGEEAASNPIVNITDEVEAALEGVRGNEVVQAVTAAAAAPTAVAATTATTVTLGTQLGLSLRDAPLLLIHFFTLVLEALRLRPQPKRWAQVIHGTQDQPIAYARVGLMNSETKKLQAVALSSLEGWYHFPLEPGHYQLVVTKHGFSFPSLSHQDGYQGENFELKRGNPPHPQLYMDPIQGEEGTAEGWRLLWKKVRVWLQRFALIVRFAGLILSVWTVIIFPHWLSWGLLIFTLFLILIQLKVRQYRVKQYV